MNENYVHTKMPEGIKDDLINGCYLYKIFGKEKNKLKVNLMGSGSIFREVIKAAQILSENYGVTAYVYSAVSYNKLYRNAIEVDRYNMLHSNEVKKEAFITELLSKSGANITVSATDYIRNYANQISSYIKHKHVVLGTDGFGRSDFRVALREFFEVNSSYIVLASLTSLSENGSFSKDIVSDAIKNLNIDINKFNPWDC
jgi:pyruvate dehydrogenase E1 component